MVAFLFWVQAEPFKSDIFNHILKIQEVNYAQGNF